MDVYILYVWMMCAGALSFCSGERKIQKQIIARCISDPFIIIHLSVQKIAKIKNTNMYYSCVLEVG